VPSAAPVVSLSTVDGHLELDLNPSLGTDPELRSQLLAACDDGDLYLVAVASCDDLVLRQDLRRAAIREFASNANLSAWALRRAALKARLGLYVFHDGLTGRGAAAARSAGERLRGLAAQLQGKPIVS
jgi:hypothetical protein